jgi:hypothetical protein
MEPHVRIYAHFPSRLEPHTGSEQTGWTRPHSEHSFSAIRDLFKIVDVIVKMAGSDDEVGGCEVADV